MKNSVEPSEEAIPSRNHYCAKCEFWLPWEAFSPSGRRGKRGQCRRCAAQYQRNLRASGYTPTGRNKALAAMPAEIRARHRWAVGALNSAMGNSRRRSQPVTVDAEYLLQLWDEQGGRCALSGLTLQTTRHSEFIASVDRVDNNLGYVPGNLRLLCWAVNRARGQLSDEEYLEVCSAVVRCNDYPGREYTQAGGSIMPLETG